MHSSKKSTKYKEKYTNELALILVSLSVSVGREGYYVE